MRSNRKRVLAAFLACSLCLGPVAAARAEEMPPQSETSEIPASEPESEAPGTEEFSAEALVTEDLPSESPETEGLPPELSAAESFTSEPPVPETAAVGEDVPKYFETTDPLLAAPPEEISGSADRSVQEEIPVYGATILCSAEEWEVLRLTNKERMKYGLQPVATYPALQRACDIRKNEIISKMAHERPDGTMCFTAFEEAGVFCNAAGENIAGGQRNPAEVVEGWMNSPGHRANILSGDFTHMGAGYARNNSSKYQRHWVQLFAGTCRPSGISVQNAYAAQMAAPGSSIDDMGLILEVTCSHGTGYLPVMDEMCSGYTVNGSSKIQTVQVSYQGAKTSFQVEKSMAVAYQTHVQSIGWQEPCYNGAMSGTQGQSKRLEAVRISLEGQDAGGDIEYRTHIQSRGWEEEWVKNGEASGTTGASKRLEAIQIRLTGEMARKYDIYYHVHAQSYGWLGWAKNGEPAGTAGYGKRLEGIEIVLRKKGEAAPGSTAGAYRCPLIQYSTHVQSYGWQGNVQDGNISGTAGQSKRLEGIKIWLSNQQYTGGVRYQTHVQSYGWESGWKESGAVSGTIGKAKRLEAIRIQLTGAMAEHYDVYYQVHAQSYGWLGWAKNGEPAGTAGYGKRLEGIRIQLVPKGGSAPGGTANAYISRSGV